MKRSPLIILFFTVVIDLLGFGVIMPLLPLYVRQFGGTPLIAGLLSASYSIMQFIFAPIWGRASDLYGRRPMILLSLIGSAVSFLVYGLATSLPILFVGRVAAGILTAAGIPTSQAYVADVTTPENRSRGMAMIGVAFGIGFAFGPWIGAVLSKHGLGLPAFFIAGLAAVNFVWSYFALPEPHVTDRDQAHARKVVLVDLKSFTSAFQRPVLGELLTVFCVTTFAFALMEATFTWLVLFRFIEPHAGPHIGMKALERMAAPVVGPLFGIVGVTIFITQAAVMGGAMRRIGDRQLVWTGSIVLAGALLGIALTPSMTWLKVFAALLALGNGMLTPALSSLVSKAAGAHERGAMMGVQQGMGSFARIIGPPLGTWLLQQFGTGIPYLVSCVLMVLAFLLSLNIKPMTTADVAAPPSMGH